MFTIKTKFEGLVFGRVTNSEYAYYSTEWLYEQADEKGLLNNPMFNTASFFQDLVVAIERLLLKQEESSLADVEQELARCMEEAEGDVQKLELTVFGSGYCLSGINEKLKTGAYLNSTH